MQPRFDTLAAAACYTAQPPFPHGRIIRGGHISAVESVAGMNFCEKSAITNSRVFHRNYRTLEAASFPEFRYHIEDSTKNFCDGLHIRRS
jgi:hypothetical protein